MSVPKILHAAHMRQPAIGVIRQMEDEQRAADALGLPWRSQLYCSVGTEGEIVVTAPPEARGRGAFKRAYYRWLREQLPHYDALLLRYAMYDSEQLRFVRNCPVPIVSMHHTLEVQELISHRNAASRVRAAVEHLVGPWTLRHCVAHAGCTLEVARHQNARSRGPDKPVYHYSNGALYGERPVIDAAIPDGPPELFILSSRYARWMGLDLLLEAASRTRRDFRLHVGGHLDEAQGAAVARDPRFVAHGFLDRAGMDRILARSLVGLSAFGIHRKDFSEGNTLKVREYLRAGVPVYAGYRDVFDDAFPYYRHGPADLEAILDYAESVRGVSRRDVSETARPIIEKKAVLASIHADIVARLRELDLSAS